MKHDLTYGPTRVFVPIEVRHSLGFIGGPDGYEERSIEHVDDAPIVVDLPFTVAGRMYRHLSRKARKQD